MTGWWFFDVPMWIFVLVFSVSFWIALFGFVYWYIAESSFGERIANWWHEKVVMRYHNKKYKDSGDDTYMNPEDWGI